MALFGVGEGVSINTNDGNAYLLFGISNPSVTGKAAPEGSLYLRSNGVSYKKTGPGDFDWEKASDAEGASIGYVFVTDVSNSGNIGDVSYVPDTVPTNTVWTECTSDTTNVSIGFLAEPAGFYSPTVSISGIQCTNLSQYGDDRRLFSGSIDVALTCAPGEYQDFVVESSTGQSTSVRVNLAGAGPEIIDISFGSYPGTQTALKEDDTVAVTVTVENDATSCWIESDKASKTYVNLSLGAEDGAGAGYRYATGTITISSVSSDSPVDAQAENALGTRGSVYTSANLDIDQVYPTITFNSITYPATQGALKNSETADVDVSVTNWSSGTDTITYSNPNSQVSIPSTGTYSQVKTVTRIGGDYNVSTNNYAISATRVANGATSSAAYVVRIANVAAALSIAEPASRLRTRSTGFSNVALTTPSTTAAHTITINSNQILGSVPTLADPAAGQGTWASGSFSNAGGMTSFTNSLQLPDNSTRGTHTWGAISGTNLAGIETTSITGNDTYTIGGFLQRYYRLVLGQNESEGAVEVTTYSKFSLNWYYTDGAGTVKSLSRSSTINESPPVTSEYTVDAVDINPTTFIILDTAATQAQTQDTAIRVEEVV
jgi:hypothetical protein